MDTHVKKTVATIALSACLCCAGMFAAYTSELSIINNFAVDTVDIELESSIAEGAPFASASEEADPPTLFDDGEIEHNITITNEGAACFIRCKSLYSKPSSDGSVSLDLFNATGNVVFDAEQWHLAEDGYLYCKSALAEGEVVFLLEMVSNAPEWRKVIVDGEEVLEGFDMTASFMVEAVQSRNFEPDFTSATPWGDVEPETCIYSRSGFGEV